MDFQLKSISVQSIPQALAKVERYRLLNEPVLAESICLDILSIAPDHQQALISLLLARTDQFHSHAQSKSREEILPRITGDYEQAYYAGVIWERLGHARIRHGDRGVRTSASHDLQDAMKHYDRAITFCSRRQRRRHSAVEHVRPRPHAEPGHSAGSRARSPSLAA